MVNPPKRRGGWCAVVSDDPETRIRGFSCTRLNSPGGTRHHVTDKSKHPGSPLIAGTLFYAKSKFECGWQRK